MEAILTVGVSASGKTTWANEFVAANPNWVIICRDDIRTDMMGGVLDWSKWNWKNEDKVTDEQTRRILAAKALNQSVIIADTNLPIIKNGNVSFSNGAKLANKLEMMGFKVSWKEFDISIEEAILRDKNRKVSVGESVIRSQYEKWEAYKNSK